MDMRSWKKVLLQWITECSFMERKYLNIEQSDIETFFQKFCLHHQTVKQKYNTLAEFFGEFYPGFQINFDDENCLSSTDYVYAYSLLLHFCCIKYPETFFHEICNHLPEIDQQCIAEFFKKFLDTESITKEVLRHAIAEVANAQVTPPRLNDSFSSGKTSTSGGGLNSASFLRCESPLKTPKRCAGTQRISPSTPKTYLLEERTRELYNLRALLDTERYEKGMLEVQIQQNLDEIQKLNDEHKKLLQKMQDLKNEYFLNTSDCSTNNDSEENQIQSHILKELSEKEQQIIKISDNVRIVNEENALLQKKLSYAEKQVVYCMDHIQDLEMKVDELGEKVEQKNEQIKYLSENKLELEKFILETRSSTTRAHPDLNASGDCLDNSLLHSSNNTSGSKSFSSPENLAVSVIDVQLREKEHENQLLKQDLKDVQSEHKRMVKDLTKLTQKFEEVYELDENEKARTGEDRGSDDQISCEEQCNTFNSCIEKIDQFHKTDKNKIKQFEQQSSRLQQENGDLTGKLALLTQEVEDLKANLTAKEKLQLELENCKIDIEIMLKKCQDDLVGCEEQKTKLFTKVQSLQYDKEQLIEDMQELKTKIEVQHQEQNELLADNKRLSESEQSLATRLQKLQNEFSLKNLQWEEQLQQLNEKILKQTKDIEVYRQTEQTFKCNHEQMLIKIEELKQEARQANSYLSDVRNELKEKEKQFQNCLNEAASEYEASMERIAVELKLEKQHHNNKEMELILSKAECNDAQKKLNEAEKEIQKLRNDIQQLQQICEHLQQFESRVIECTEENNQMRKEIETFKQQVNQNALRLLEADRSLAEFMDLTKEQDAAKRDVKILQNKLNEKEFTVREMENDIKLLKQQIEEHQDLTATLKEEVENLAKDKERLKKEAEEKVEQILNEQQDKHMLLTSLEKTTDQLKLVVAEKQQQTLYLEQKLKNLEEQYTSMSVLKVESEAELRLCLEEQQQQKNDFEQKLNEKSDQLQSIHNSLTEILAIMENNFNLPKKEEQQQGEKVLNVFNYQENKSDKNTQNHLRKYLNHILSKQKQLKEKLQEITTQKEEVVGLVASLKDTNCQLLAKLTQQKEILKETQEKLENEELVIEKRLFQELKRLQEDLLNLEKVNEHLTDENVKIRDNLSKVEEEFEDSKLKIESLENNIQQLKQEVHSKSLLIEKLQKDDQKLRQSLKEKSQQIDKLTEKAKQLEVQVKDKNAKLQNLEKEHQEAKSKSQKQQQNQQAELKKSQEKLKLLQASNDTLETEVGNKNKELLVEKNRCSDTLQQHKEIDQQLSLTLKKLDEMVTHKLNAETKCQQLQSEVQQLRRDLDFTKVQQQTQQEDSIRLNEEIQSLKVDKQHLRDEMHENKLTLQRANDNVTQLIQQNSSIRLEKEAILEENLLLRKQLEETGKNQTSSETKMKSIMEKSQDLERKLLTAENELKSLKVNWEKSEKSAEKLLAENKKLRDSQETSTKRIEKLALKLGDSQARSSKLERDNEKLHRTLEAHSATVEALQKEKDLLQAEAKSLKERLSRAERGHEQLAAKVKSLEHLNTNLQQIKQKLEASEIDGKTKINKLEKMRESNDEKIRKLTNSINNAESDNVKLNLEIGALNSQLKETKAAHNQEQSQQIEEFKQKLTEAEELSLKYSEVNEKLKIELNTLKEENSSVKDQLSKVSLSLQITTQKCERFVSEIEQIRTEMLAMRQEKTQIEKQHETSVQKINEFEQQNSNLAYESKSQVKSLEQKIAQLEEELAEKSKKLGDLQKETEMLKENSEYQNSLTAQNTAVNLTELEDLRSKLSLAEEIRLKEQEISLQLRKDNQILHTKYQEAKQRALDAAKTSEERIKENRLELEGKLEKMKSKMKTLYTEEITKMKTKQDREMAVIKSELEVLKAQNSKYEEHTRKLSNQIVRLNDNILQHQKENTALKTKLKHVMDQLHESERIKRPSSIHVSTISSSTTSVTGPNLAMEDEEGEQFDNTYLTDLKTGRMSELISRDVCVEELKYRNSMLPPHLRSTYAAQFDHEFPEDDLKDGNPHSFDDSMSALLSTTAGGTRKKCSGVTHYKRPGPPTPSKHGGRLSFGGSSEPAREILKESADMNPASAVVTSSTKTPIRFNFFASRFSMGNSRDEKSNTKKDTNELNLRKVIHKTKIKGSAGVGCTSTPRKSKIHYDQRRLLDQLMKSSPSPSPLTANNKNARKEMKITPPDVSIIETPVTTLAQYEVPCKSSRHKTVSKRLEAIAGGLRRSRRNSSMFGRRLSRRMQEICTPTSGETTSSALSTPAVAVAAVNDKVKRRQVVVSSSATTTSGRISTSNLLQKRLRKRAKKEKGSRPSLCLRGTIFVKHRTPNKGVLQDLIRYKSRKQRFERFNDGRDFKSFKAASQEKQEQETDKTISCEGMKNMTYDLKNKYYTNKNLRKDTIGIATRKANKQKLVEDGFTFDEEQLLQMNAANYESEDEDSIIAYDFTDQKELVTSKDLDDFDRFIANRKSKTKHSKQHDNHLSRGSLQHFEKLLVETESIVPFEIKSFSDSKSSHSTNSNHSHHSSQSQTHSHHDHDSINLTTATPHITPSNHTCNLSRTIYGGTVIYNHRLPHINTTFVRKSSIYIKNRKRSSSLHNLESSSACNDVVLITNQTITFVDIMRMWTQMDSSTRIIVSFAILASFTTLFGLFYSLCSRS